MHYYIDGYNLLFRLKHGEEDPFESRQILIEDINSKAALLNLQITIVFDSQYREGEAVRSQFRQLHLMYSGQGVTADQCILDAIALEPNPNHITVVTSDKKLAWFARRCTAKTETVEQFIQWITKRTANRLRQKQQLKRPLKKPVTVRKEEVPKDKDVKKPQKPSLKASVEECFDFYLEQFEEELEKLPVKKKKEKKPSRKKAAPKPKEKYISDAERWLRAFEKGETETDIF